MAPQRRATPLPHPTFLGVDWWSPHLPSVEQCPQPKPLHTPSLSSRSKLPPY
ncbi:hypothetical protein Hanom_Chr08g00707111 [Helianthus anomalus]